MKVSVVIPAYNEQRFINDCLLSLAHQEEKPDEIILIDNNSTDRTVEISERFGLRVLKERRQGIAFARNRGFNEARFEIVARCDADSVLPPDWIKKIKKDFSRNTIDALVSPLAFYDLFLKGTLAIKLYNSFLKLILHHYPLNGPNMVLTKKIWNKVKDKVCLDDKKVHEDIDLSIHIAEAGGKIGYDKTLIIQISGRRIKNNPASFFLEYPLRVIRTIQVHGSKGNR